MYCSSLKFETQPLIIKDVTLQHKFFQIVKAVDYVFQQKLELKKKKKKERKALGDKVCLVSHIIINLDTQ